ncbi:MAG: hypothetical protein ACOYEV_19260 [Candidatus Nanopelagicales bacterium]
MNSHAEPTGGGVLAADNILDYMDQASFLGLRALGRGPQIQFTWIYDHPVDLDGLRRFQRNLGHGLLGRRIERSALPFGRHRWVTYSGPADLEIAAGERSRAEIMDWVDEQIEIPLDPETGPPWRMAVLPIAGGGAAVTLVVSHTICDGLGICLAIAEAAKGVTHDFGYPSPNTRSRKQARREDLREFVREIPKIGKALVAGIRLAAKNKDEVSKPAKTAALPVRRSSPGPFRVPMVVAYIDEPQWDGCAKKLGGSSNSLVAGIASRLGALTGRVDQQGKVKLTIPVSERIEGDTRGNALNVITLTINPATVTGSLAELRNGMKQELVALSQSHNDLLAPLPLTPLIPARLAGRLEALALGAGAPIGSSNGGQYDPYTNRPDGTDADFIFARQIDSGITAEVLDRLGGLLFVASGTTHGQVYLTITAWQAGGENSREQLASDVRTALSEFGLSGIVE